MMWPSERETDRVAEGQLGTARGRERATESVPVRAEVMRRKMIEKNMSSGRGWRVRRGEFELVRELELGLRRGS